MRQIILIVSSLLLVAACKKEQINTPDYRERFTGNFLFTTITESWIMGQPTVYDTTLYSGTIMMNPDLDSNLIISFLPAYQIDPDIDANGNLIEEFGNHYHHKGKFIGTDSIEFIVDGLGGLGGGANYEVGGARQ